MLLAIGMITVFTILALIVVFGSLLTSFVNKYFPETKVNRSYTASSHQNASIAANKIAAIVSAVDIVTEGKARISSIKKED